MKIVFFIITFASLLFAEMGIALKNVNIREDASISSLKVGLLIKNDVVDILDVLPNKDNPEWYKIDRGYVSAMAFTFLQSEPLVATARSLKDMNIRERPSTRALKTGMLKEEEVVNILTAIPDKDNPIWYETDKGYIYAKFLTIGDNKPTVKFARALKNVNIREEASLDSLKLGLLKEGEVVNILNAIPDKDNPEWYETDRGYVYAKFLSTEKKQKNKIVKFLNTKELEELLIGKQRVGKTRYFKNGEYFKSKFNIDGTVDISIYNKNGEKIRDIIQAKWIISDNAFCVVINNNVLDTSCRKVFKNSNDVYVSVLMSDKNIWAKFLME